MIYKNLQLLVFTKFKILITIVSSYEIICIFSLLTCSYMKKESFLILFVFSFFFSASYKTAYQSQIKRIIDCCMLPLYNWNISLSRLLNQYTNQIDRYEKYAIGGLLSLYYYRPNGLFQNVKVNAMMSISKVNFGTTVDMFIPQFELVY